MRFELTQRYDSPAAEVTAAYADPLLYPTLVGLPKLGGIEVLDHDIDGPRASLSVRFRFTGDLPSAVTAVIDPGKLTWVQRSRHDLTAGSTAFDLVPDHYPDRLRASGTFAERATTWPIGPATPYERTAVANRIRRGSGLRIGEHTAW